MAQRAGPSVSATPRCRSAPQLHKLHSLGERSVLRTVGPSRRVTAIARQATLLPRPAPRDALLLCLPLPGVLVFFSPIKTKNRLGVHRQGHRPALRLSYFREAVRARGAATCFRCECPWVIHPPVRFAQIISRRDLPQESRIVVHSRLLLRCAALCGVSRHAAQRRGNSHHRVLLRHINARRQMADLF